MNFFIKNTFFIIYLFTYLFIVIMQMKIYNCPLFYFAHVLGKTKGTVLNVKKFVEIVENWAENVDRWVTNRAVN